MRALAWIALLLLPGMASAEWQGGIPGGYLRFGSSARTFGLGGVDLVMGSGADAAYGNPALIGLLPAHEVSLTHVTLYEGAAYDVATGALPGQTWGGVSLAVVSLRCDGFEQRGEYDNRYSMPGEEFGTAQTALLAGWGHDMGSLALGTSVGGRGKLVAHSMLDHRAVGFGVDIGFEHRMVLPYVHRWLAPLTLGFTLSNAVPPRLRLDEDAERFARRLDAGVSYDIASYGALGLQACVAGEGSRRMVAGAEGWPRDDLALRIGVNEDEFAAGVGFRWKSLMIDYGVAWHEELPASHRVSLMMSRPQAVSVDREGSILPREATRWVLQHYREPEAARIAHRVARTWGHGRASRLYRFVVGQHPQTVWAAHGWRWFGDRAYEREEWPDAEADLMRLFRHPSRDEVAEAQTWFRLGDAGEHNRHWRTAIDGYELVIAAPGESEYKEKSYFNAGGVYFLHLKDYPATVRVYEEAVTRYPGHDLADAYFRLGRSYAELTRWQSCVERMDAFLDRYPVDPRVPEALFWSGRAFYELGLVEDALPRLEHVVEGYPLHEVADDAILFKGHCRRLQGDLELARIEYARVVKDYPVGDSAPLAQLALAIVLQEEGSRELAIREFQRFLANYPSHPGGREAEDRLRSLNR